MAELRGKLFIKLSIKKKKKKKKKKKLSIVLQNDGIP